MMMVGFSQKSMFPGNWEPQHQRNRFAHAKLALRAYSEVTRRDGLSSWRVIFFVAVGMLSGNSGTNYVAKIFGVEFSDGRTNSFWPGPIFQPSLIS